MNWEQLKTILWLRWCLTRNQWSRSGGLGAVLTAILLVMALSLGGAGFFGGLLGGALGLGQAQPMLLTVIWLGATAGFLFFWMVGLLSELQRSETIDLQRLMHLPVALGQMFAINYAASHLALSIVLFLPAMTGLALGLAWSRGLLWLALLPLVWGMVFMITAWTYCLRGWLAALMSNPRRRRTVIMGITMAFVLFAQLPNLYFNVFGRSKASPKPPDAAQPGIQTAREKPKAGKDAQLQRLLAFQSFLPPFWVSVGAQGLAERRVLPALLGTLGCFGLGAIGLRRAYVSTLRFYLGETGGKAGTKTVTAPARVTALPPGKPARNLLARRLPGVPEQAGALAVATFHSMLRAPEVKMTWATSFLVTIFLGATFLFRGSPNVPDLAKPFIAPGSAFFSLFMLIQFFVNQFGFDRDGFRTLILCPASRKHILLGKNLACLPAGLGFSTFLLLVISVWLRLPVLLFVAGLFQVLALLFLAGLAGNLLSILVPYRVQSGSLKPTKMPARAVLMMVICQLMFPVVMAPVFLPPLAELLWRSAGGAAVVPVNLLFSLMLAGLTAGVYWWSLTPLGELLQRREMKILHTLTADVE